ncbi:hypothetical protein HK101_005564 [Irineochytrium annulatum]|nr:hypothetical protein HK101_005564 [Irineochytrium annulatum]
MSFAHSPTSAAEINQVLAQLHYVCNHLEKAKEYSAKALEGYEGALGREHSLTLEARGFFKTLVGEMQTSRGVSAVNRRQSIIV